MPTNLTKIAAEVVGNEMTTAERLPVLCEIVRKTEHLQVRAIAVLYADCEWENTHETWTTFCRHEFKWDDSYASRMKKAAQMIIESQARALATVSPDKREDVLGKARDKAGSEPSATQISAVIKAEPAEGSALTDGMTEAQDEIDDCISDLRTVLKRIKALDPKNVGRWINLAHLIADMKSAADTLKHARPHAACDELGNHDASCLCGGNNWLPKHVIERPKSEKNK